jgi:hypothetical protein
MEDESAIKYELEALPDSDKERFERIRAAQIEKHGSERPERIAPCILFGGPRIKDRNRRVSKKETSHYSAALV